MASVPLNQRNCGFGCKVTYQESTSSKLKLVPACTYVLQFKVEFIKEAKKPPIAMPAQLECIR